MRACRRVHTRMCRRAHMCSSLAMAAARRQQDQEPASQEQLKSSSCRNPAGEMGLAPHAARTRRASGAAERDFWLRGGNTTLQTPSGHTPMPCSHPTPHASLVCTPSYPIRARCGQEPHKKSRKKTRSKGKLQPSGERVETGTSAVAVALDSRHCSLKRLEKRKNTTVLEKSCWLLKKGRSWMRFCRSIRTGGKTRSW